MTTLLSTEPDAATRTRRRVLSLLGPAFVASVAYVDPGNFATNFAAGAEHGYRLVWVVVTANLVAILVQYLTSKLGLVTGRSLPELCRERFGRRSNRLLWVQAEVVAMATDLAEFVGAAVGLHLLFGMPLLPAGLVTAVVAFGILGLEQRGHRRFERAVIALLALVAAGFGYLVLAAGPPAYDDLAAGLVPRLDGGGELQLTIGIIGATVMPHVVYLHSALQSGRVAASDASERRSMLRANRWDCVLGLGAAGLVNLAMLCIAAVVFHGSGIGVGSDFAGIHAQLGTLLGGGAALAFAVALVASGVSSSSVGTYAGQVVMAGFVTWRVPLLVRRAVTMLPALLVLAVSADTGQVLVLSQVVLSFGIPFALVPLLLLTRDRSLLGPQVNRRTTTAAMLVVTVVISGLNACVVADVARGLW
ncbi:divalent metal cation transporter MntH [Marmoricola endophyticus]|uniref:Divalent metal cation transporter MntH n=1 Tax=Marmoricola endophyticus TaxID=2040280 RepID=A0A917BNA0_9ACTN|nr:Nramp family divalent metal transporter [Marmoricola endophyticus]GGF50482.1 divalent metal cation transporter MntH [Marmoricola endophyticus]